MTTDNREENNNVDDAAISSKRSRQYATPAQDNLTKELNFLEKELALAVERRDNTLVCDDGITKKIEKLRKSKSSIEKELKKKKNKAVLAKKYRSERDQVLKNVTKEKPELMKNLHVC